jgi:hypothetical protein
MKLKWIFIFLFLIILTDLSYSQKTGPSKKSTKPIITSVVHSLSTDYIISDFVDINPNPFIDLLNIEILEEGEEIIQIDILSIVGKVVKNFSLPSQSHYTLNLSDLEKGVYLLKINNGKFSCVKRIIHQ